MIRELSFIDVLYLIAATRWTLALTAIAFLGGGLVGLAIALLRVSALAPLRWLGTVYVLVVQGTPLLAWLFVFFFGLSIFGFTVSPWIAAAASYSIYAGAFLGEIWRGCLQAIPRTQWEAGASLGLGFTQQLRYIIVPQALRLAIPPDRRLPGAAHQEHLAGRRHRLHRADPRGPAHHRHHLPSLHRLPDRCRHLLRALLPADAGIPAARAEAPCRSLNSQTWSSATARTRC